MFIVLEQKYFSTVQMEVLFSAELKGSSPGPRPDGKTEHKVKKETLQEITKHNIFT